MPTIRCQVQFEHDSGLPRDRISNTWHFNAADTSSVRLNEAAERVRDFYLQSDPVHQAGARPVVDHLSTSIADNGHRINTYIVGASPGAPPDHIEQFDILGRLPFGGNNWPDEVALAFSYKNTVELQVPASRRRGRVFIGPLRSSAGDNSNSTSPRPTITGGNTLVGALLGAGRALLGKNTGLLAWSVWSPTLNRDFIIDKGHVDNAFDTMRSRGVDPTERFQLV